MPRKYVCKTNRSSSDGEELKRACTEIIENKKSIRC